MSTVSTMQPHPTRGAYQPVEAGWQKTIYDDTPLPGGLTVGTADDRTFRNHLKNLLKGYDATWGRETCAEKWAAEVARVQAVGAKAALAEWFQQSGG